MAKVILPPKTGGLKSAPPKGTVKPKIVKGK